MTTGGAPVLPLFLRCFVLLPEARHVRHDDIHGALALSLSASTGERVGVRCRFGGRAQAPALLFGGTTEDGVVERWPCASTSNSGDRARLACRVARPRATLFGEVIDEGVDDGRRGACAPPSSTP
jgi:hypothetical protein